MLRILQIIDDLNQELAEKDLETKFFYIVETNNNSFIIKLCEHNNYGYAIELFNSESNDFNEDIETFYEDTHISYNHAVKLQIKSNLKNIVSELTILRGLT